MPEVASSTIEKLGSCSGMSEEKTKPFFYDQLAWVYLKERDYKKSGDNYLKADALIRTREDAALNGINRLDLLCDISFASLKCGDLINALAYAKKALGMVEIIASIVLMAALAVSALLYTIHVKNFIVKAEN